MARFVLVHGAFSGAWIWGPLSDRLKTAGHSVDVFDLPGSGNDYTPASGATLDAYAACLCEVLASNSEPAIVASNSMGGIVATQGAARCPSCVRALVYVTAFLPKGGQSLLDLTKLPEGSDDQVQANITIEGDPPLATMPTAASRQALYGFCTDDVAAWAIARQRPQPVAPFVTPVSIPLGALDDMNRYYVICTRDRAIPLALQRRMIAENVCTDLRRTAHRLMRRSGVDSETRRKIMGHKTDAMDRRYGVVEDDDVVEAVGKLDAAFRERMGNGSKQQPKADLNATIDSLPPEKRVLVESLVRQIAAS